METKVCCVCGQEKPLIAFYIRKSGRRAGKPYSKCIHCHDRPTKEAHDFSHGRNWATAFR